MRASDNQLRGELLAVRLAIRELRSSRSTVRLLERDALRQREQHLEHEIRQYGRPPIARISR